MLTAQKTLILSSVLFNVLCFIIIIAPASAAYDAPWPQWTMTYPRTVNYSVNGSAAYIYGDSGRSIMQTSDGGFAVVADIEDHYYLYYNEYYGSVVENRTVLLIRTNSLGHVLFEVGVPNMTTSRSIVGTSDLGYAICGLNAYNYPSMACLVKLDSIGNLQWSKTFGSQVEAIQTSDGGYLVTGALQADSGPIANVLKLNENGNVVWNKTFPSTQVGGYSFIYSAVQLNNGNYGVVGFKDNAWLAILDSQGNIALEKNFAGNLYAVQVGNDSSLVAVGSVSQNNAGSPVSLGLIRKIDLQGNELWNRTFSNPVNHADQWFNFNSIIQLSDGGFIAAGDDALFKVNINGTLQWYQSSSSDVTNQLGTHNALLACSDGGFATTGNLWENVWLAKYPGFPDQVIPEMTTSSFVVIIFALSGFVLALTWLTTYHRKPKLNIGQM